LSYNNLAASHLLSIFCRQAWVSVAAKQKKTSNLQEAKKNM
jgi:hypothetical protein